MSTRNLRNHNPEAVGLNANLLESGRVAVVESGSTWVCDAHSVEGCRPFAWPGRSRMASNLRASRRMCRIGSRGSSAAATPISCLLPLATTSEIDAITSSLGLLFGNSSSPVPIRSTLRQVGVMPQFAKVPHASLHDLRIANPSTKSLGNFNVHDDALEQLLSKLESI